MSSCCLSRNTVILQEHSNCPFTDPGAFSSLPVTNRSILQQQRCQPPLFERTIRRRVRWPGWTMLEMTFLASVCLPLSLTFSVYDCWCRGGQRSKHMPTTPQPPFLPVDVLYSQLFQAVAHMANRYCLLIWSPLPDKTVVFFRCSISMMCKLMRVYSHRHRFHICGQQISCLLMEKVGFKMDANKWLHK